MENAAAQAKHEGQNIHRAFQYKTGAYLSQMGGATLRWHTPLSRPFTPGRLCKNEGRTMQNGQNTLEDPRKTMKHGAAQTKSEGQNTHMSHTQIYIYIYICTHNIVIFWPSGPFLCHRRCAGVSLLARFLAHPALVGPWAAGWDQAPRCHGALVETAQDLARPPGRRSSCVDRCSLAS